MEVYNCKLIVNKGIVNFSGQELNNSKITIGPNANAYFSGNTNITCDDNSVFEINGTLKLGSSTTFAPVGTGKIILNGAIVSGTNSSIIIDNTSNGSDFLHIGNKQIDVSANISLFKLKDMQVKMTGSSSRIKFLGSSTNVYIDNITMTSSNITHKGIYFYNNNSIIIKNSIFRNANYAIYSYGLSTKSTVEVDDCSFENCNIGFYANKRTVDLVNCNFEYCNIGFKATSQYGQSVVNSCNSTGDNNNSTYDYGINYTAYSGAELIIIQSTIDHYRSGIWAYGPCNVKVRESFSVDNYVAGIETNGGVSLYLAAGYGNNSLYGNKYAVTFTNGKYLYLRQGYNNFISDYKCFNGNSTTLSGFVYADYNRWKDEPGSPVFNEDYTLTGLDGHMLELIDNHPLNGTTIPDKPIDDGPIVLKNISPITENEFITQEISTSSYPNTSLDLAVENALIGGMQKSQTIDINQKVDLLCEILSYNYKELNKSEEWVLDYALVELHKELTNLVENDEIRPRNAIQVYNHLISKVNKFSDNKKERKINYKLAKVDIFMLSKKYDKALLLLDKLLNQTSGELNEKVQRRYCEANAEIAVINGEIEADMMEEYIEGCNPDFGTKIATLSQDVIDDKEVYEEIESLKVYPNPVYETSEIITLISDDCRGRILVYDITGKMIKTYDLTSGENHNFIYSGELSNGIYYIILEENNMIKEKKKMIMK